VSGELTYGLERLAMYVQGVDNVYDLNFNGRPEGEGRISYGDVFLQAEQECAALLKAGETEGRHMLALPAYDQCIKASHAFNLLDARGVISVTERQAYILRVRELAKGCCVAWSKTAGGGAQ
jgi:glycyl-tRNA synthetase alpha chain